MSAENTSSTATSTNVETTKPTTTSTSEPETITRKHWLPLESNPDLMNKYIHTLGVTPFLEFHEILGTDPDLLAMVPTPVSAVLFLYPITEASESYKKEELRIIKEKGNVVNEKVYFVKQNIGNACGTIGLLHSILNNPNIELEKDKFFAKFHTQTKNMNAAERADALEANTDIEESHQAVASEAKSDVSHASNDNLHFISFVHVEGHLYELDGCKDAPINHGQTSAATLLQDAVRVISGFMERDPKEIRFNMVALAPASQYDD